MSEPGCLVCGSDTFEPHLVILRRCRACGFVTALREKTHDAKGLYGDDYFEGSAYLDYRSDEAFFKKNFRNRLKDLLRRTPDGGRLLEIGSAYGFFLDLAKHHFDVVGYEINEEGARHARQRFGADVRSDDFLCAGAAEIGGPFDVAVLWDVIEHLERPDRVLARVSDFSRPGTLLYVTTPDIGSILARWRGQRWRMIHPPTHLHYFSRETLTRLLSRHGFRVVKIRSVGVARSLRQVLYSVLVLHMGQRRAYEACARWVPSTWGFTLNTFDIMHVVAERSSKVAPTSEPFSDHDGAATAYDSAR